MKNCNGKSDFDYLFSLLHCISTDFLITHHLSCFFIFELLDLLNLFSLSYLGESFLICTKAERKIGEKLVKSSLPPVTSCLGRTDISNSLKRAILEVCVPIHHCSNIFIFSLLNHSFSVLKVNAWSKYEAG